MDKPAKKLTGNQCLCRGCGEYFSTVQGFERHRAGGVCRNPADLGQVLSPTGFWKRPVTAKGRQYLEDLKAKQAMLSDPQS